MKRHLTCFAFAFTAVGFLPSALPAAPGTMPDSPPATAPAVSMPADLRTAIELAQKVEAARVEAMLSTWDIVDTLPTIDPVDKTKWRPANADANPSPQGLNLVTKSESGGTATYAAKRWTLPVGVTYEAMIPAGPLADVSLKLLPSNQPFNDPTPPTGVALIVGGRGNTENDLEFLGQANRNIGGPVLHAGKWCKVTLLMSTTTLVATIDGQPVANEPLPARRGSQQLELTLCTRGDGALFRNVTVLKPRPRDNSVTATAPAQPGDDQKSAVQAAAKYLGDSKFELRQAASDALFMLRPASIETLQQLKDGDDMEIITRATQLLTRISNDGKPSPPTPTRSSRPQFDRPEGFGGDVQLDLNPLLPR